MQQSTACLHFRGVQRRCVRAIGRLRVAACVAAAVDRQARQSCRVWCGGVNKAYGVTESWDITNMSYKSAILKKSSSNWLNSGKPLTQQLKGAISAFPGFPGRAETVVK